MSPRLHPPLVRALGRRLAPGLAFLAAGLTGYAALAQENPSDIDVAAIRARAAEQVPDAEALAATIRKRGDALIEDAKATASEGEANGHRYTELARKAERPSTSDTFDFDKMVADAGTIAAKDLGAAPRFIAFASSSMPTASLKTMLHDVTRAGGVVVFRGLPNGSVAGLTQTLRRVLDPGENLDGIGIDPRLFRAFGIEAVPAYVMAASDFDLCDGFDCGSTVPPHDRISGNVTARFALETFANGAGPGARLAALHLARLGGDAP
jgi:conjugal transfer pilus assembly protein TrbC